MARPSLFDRCDRVITDHESSIGTEGSRNSPGHRAGGSRIGAGRKPKSGSPEPAAIIDRLQTALNAVCRLAGQACDEKTAHLRLTLTNGASIDLDLAAITAAASPQTADALDTSAERNDFLGAMEVDELDETGPVGYDIDPSLQTPKVSSSASALLVANLFAHGLVEQIFGALPDHRQAQQNLPEEGMPEQLLPEEHMLSEPYGLQRQSPASAAEQTTILSSLFGTPAPHASQSFDPSTSASLGWTSLSNFELAHSAVNSALRNQSAPGQPEDNVAGPFVILPPDLTAMNKLPTLYGPIDPAIVPTHPPAVIYYVSRRSETEQAAKRTENVAVQTIETDQSAHSQPPRKRGRRKCAICNSIDCPGTGGRRHCPAFNEDIPAHHARPGPAVKQASPVLGQFSPHSRQASVQAGPSSVSVGPPSTQVFDHPNLADITVEDGQWVPPGATFRFQQPVLPPEAGPSRTSSAEKRKEPPVEEGGGGSGTEAAKKKKSDRAPRTCKVCMRKDCKGRGGRQFCEYKPADQVGSPATENANMQPHIDATADNIDPTLNDINPHFMRQGGPSDIDLGQQA